MGEVEEKPVQKCTTAGAESVPPAPWVKIKDRWSGVVEDGVYVWQMIGFLTCSEFSVTVLTFSGASCGVSSFGVCSAFTSSSTRLLPDFVLDFDSDFAAACFALSVVLAPCFSILRLHLFLPVLCCVFASVCACKVCDRVDERVTRLAGSAGDIDFLPLWRPNSVQPERI